jgi:hypothetical protein
MSQRLMLLLLAMFFITPPATGRAEPRRAAGVVPATGARPRSRPPPASRPAEYRFDALRVDGRLHGPEALTVHGMTGGARTPLMRRGRSFLHRILETLEDPALHAAPGG